MSPVRLLLVSLLLACSGGGQDSAALEVKRTTLTDEGTACVQDGAVQVTFPYCLSSSCDTLVSATCEAELVDGVVVVHGEAIIDTQGVTCTADCGIVQATCALPTVEDPDATNLSYGGADHPVSDACPPM